MRTYQDRLKSFVQWPASHRDFVKRLAIMGQYSTDSTALSSCCVFCHAHFERWELSMTPLLEHLHNNKNACPIFRLKYLGGRKALSHIKPSAKPSQMPSEVAEYLNRKFIQLNITDQDLFLCMRCGSSSLKHECDGKVQAICPGMDLKLAQFFIRYLNGDFIEQVELYIQRHVALKEEQRAMVSYLLGIDKANICAFETLEAFLQRGSEKIFQDLERKMKSIEGAAVEAMYNESMVI